MDFGSKKTKDSKGSRKASSPVDAIDFDLSALTVPKAIIDEITSKDLDYRWINTSELQRHGGHHKHRWEIYRPSSSNSVSGAGADGSIRRGDLVLAVRSKPITEAYKQRVQQRNRANEMYNKRAASELREGLADGGVSTRVDDSFDE